MGSDIDTKNEKNFKKISAFLSVSKDLLNRQHRDLLMKIIKVAENERKLLAQEIHDSISGGLAAIKLALEEKLESMESNPKPDVISLEKIISQVDEIIKESRRIAFHLRPSMLDDLGLLPAMSWLCREFEQLHPDVKVEQQLDISEDEIPEKLKVVIYRVLQEAMNNVAKHSEATQVRVKLDKRNNRVELSIADNGNGFDIEKKSSESDLLTGYGISSMRDRASLCDGYFEIVSEKAKGTTVCISIPYKDE